MKTYRITNNLNLDAEAKKIVKANENSRKYNYSYDQVMDWLKQLPKKGDKINLENAQCTCYYSNLFSHWGTWSVGYTYCLGVVKDAKNKTCTISISKQQTVGRKAYNIDPITA